MYCKKQIKRKAMLLSVCSILGVGAMVDDHAMAMKSLKKLLSSVPSEEKIMKLAYAKLAKTTVDLSKSEEEKLAAYVNNVVLPGGYIKVMNDKGKILKVNPLIFHINKYNKIKFNNEKFMSIVNWVRVHIPEAFNPYTTNENKITTPRSPLIFTMQNFTTSQPEVASTICNALIPCTDLSKKYLVELESRPNGSKVTMDMNGFDLVQCEQYKSIVSTVPAFSSNHQVLFSHAVLSENIDEVTKALFAGADVNSKIYVKPYGNITPLDFALTARNGALFDCLIRHGAKVSPNLSVLKLIFARDSKEIDKFWATRSNISFLEKVLTCDKLSVTWNAKYTDFFKAGEVWESNIIREFVTKRAGITEFALNDIVRNNRLTEDKKIEAVNFIFQNQTLTSKRLNFDLGLAISDCNWKLAKLLIEKGASVEPTTMFGSSPLGNAVFAPTREIMSDTSRGNALITEEWVQFIRFLVNDCKASISNAMSSGNGLCHAFERFFFADVRTPQKQDLVLEVTEFLIEKGMNLNAVDRQGKTILGGWVTEQQIEEERLLSTMGTRLYNLFVQNGAKKYI